MFGALGLGAEETVLFRPPPIDSLRETGEWLGEGTDLRDSRIRFKSGVNRRCARGRSSPGRC